MKTDSIFYRLFQAFPGTFFELINRQASEANAYEFASVELKQTAFRIDGIFLPVPNLRERPIYFLEVQFQKDPEFYSRFFCEIFLYLRLYAPTKAWHAVVVFPRRSLEPIEIEPYRVLLESSQITRLYLNELGNTAEQSLGVGMIKLVVETKKRTPERVRQLVDKARSELADEAVQRQVLDLIETIVLYKLPLINRQELARMFGLNELRKTRYYQEVREEVREELQQEVRQAVRQELQQEVRQEEALELIKRLLQRRLGAVNPELQEQVNLLSVAQLENLAEALLDFSNEADLVTWLSENSNQLD
ncbi:MAG: Rpn family recombination-promoting nuclease/putative transposase [Symplocastrum torsivum CPER-KK1]|uniref:Rpn family recombination-promoting nuclease/putative transposase n=1 Tax=Symplocastrum torsivum CPER-KK1 TaxID=450513 RepID=A0A951U8Z9_9CYAN|nr:Rpn family recombination-promoting nuclease/putative transposase [Symplocastrum torsivum CPER-KK1]